jgi:hypothetical protein
MLVVSLLLLGGVIAGYAAVSSPELRGPYATPRPGVVGPQATPAADGFRATLVPSVQFAIPVADCYRIALPHQSTFFVSGRTVTLLRPAADPPQGIETIIAVTANGTGVMWNACAKPLWPVGAEPVSR